jgi:hypothetical protein
MDGLGIGCYTCDDGEKERKEMGYMRTLYTS